jgi:hypothetical protein
VFRPLVKDKVAAFAVGKSGFDKCMLKCHRVPFPIGYCGHDLGWLFNPFCAPELALRPEFDEGKDAGVACHLEQDLRFVVVWKIG